MHFLSEALQAYVAAASPQEAPLLAALRRETHLKVLYPQMISSAVQGRWLAFISQLLRPRRILEIGTFTGYSTLCMAEGLAPEGELITIDQHAERAYLVRKYVSLADLEDRVSIQIGDAAQLIPAQSGHFDLIFLDADKANYPLYLEQLLPMMHKQSLLLADNVLWHGHVLEEARNKETRGIKRFNQMIQEREDMEGLILPVDDGMYWVRKN